MFSRSSKTVRIRNIPDDVPKETLVAYAEALCEPQTNRKFLGIFPRRPQIVGHPLVSLAPQSGHQTATITFPSEKLKRKDSSSHEGWDFDDDFNGLTVLHAVPEPDLDICAIHGFNGNAFDTFAWEDGHMWLRDFLPSHPKLKQSRVMTYGYSSLLNDSANTSGVAEWASGLLGAISSVREKLEERSRPIIFVCHSLGGLVAREAMVELNREPQLYEGLELKYCGLLFLATPHSGATLAVWNPYLVQLAELTGIRARDFTQILEAFNNSSRISKREFGRLNPQPPLECLYETREMKVAGLKRRIVTPDAAGLNSVAANPMGDVDHTQICRFPRNVHPGYVQIGACLERIRDRIVRANAPGDVLPQQNPAQPAMNQPPPAPNNAANIAVPISPPQERPQAAHETDQPPAHHGIRGGEGTGGNIDWDGTSLSVGGGHATGASMSLRDLQKFSGSVKGGTGLGATIST
ncbi:hypothetical protein F5Y19DRAFT_333118 [Xylariaceae sp. FL1651]|nr:hypothetical protein F5Y19DRAFT_333118 [Xylariaceae sp. FL1651]